jgi:hypothetical protein
MWVSWGLALGACYHRSEVAPIPNGSVEDAVARAIGARLRLEYQDRFVIYPAFIRVGDHMTSKSSDTEELRTLELVREAAGAQFADTVAYQDTIKVAQLPEAQRYYFTLSALPHVMADTALVSVFMGSALTGNAPVSMSVMTYVFARKAGEGWVFVRRKLQYAS